MTLSHDKFWKLTPEEISNLPKQEVSDRVEEYYQLSRSDEKGEISNSLAIITYVSNIFAEIERKKLEVRIDDLEKANEFSWFGIVMSVALLPVGGAIIGGLATRSLTKILKGRMLMGTTMRTLRLPKEMSKADRLSLEKIATSVTEAKHFTKATFVKNVVVNENSWENIAINKIPSITSNIVTGTIIEVQDKQKKNTNRKKAVDINVIEHLFALQVNINAQIKKIERSYIQTITDVKVLFLDTSDESKQKQNSIIENIKNNIEFERASLQSDPTIKKGLGNFTDHQEVKIMAQSLIYTILYMSTGVPVEIVPATPSTITAGYGMRNLWGGGKRGTKKHVRANPTQIQILLTVAKYLLDPIALKNRQLLKNGQLITFTNKYAGVKDFKRLILIDMVEAINVIRLEKIIRWVRNNWY